MATARDRVAELADIAERGHFRNRWLAETVPSMLLWELRSRIKRGEIIGNLLPFFPIRAVTAIEVFFRLAVANLFDEGLVSQKNAETLTKLLKFDYSTVHALLGKKFSLGELIGHTLHISSLESIVSVMNAITGKDFKSEISQVRDRWAVEVQNKPDVPIISNIDEVFSYVAELFDVRHIAVHELPDNDPFTIEDVTRYLEASRLFLAATNWFVSELIAPNAPLQQSTMTTEAWKSADAADNELQAILRKIKPHVGERRAALLDEAQETWVEFRKRAAEFRASEFEGGTIAPQIRAMEFEDVTRGRIDVLRSLLQLLERQARREAE